MSAAAIVKMYLRVLGRTNAPPGDNGGGRITSYKARGNRIENSDIQGFFIDNPNTAAERWVRRVAPHRGRGRPREKR
jgi:hypothetical protein